MKYKQALYFIGKCLSLSQYPNRRLEVYNQIKKGEINWPKIVKVSTGHMVLPAVYLNLNRTNLLQYLPEDLAVYCEEITCLNRRRNKAIIQQSKTITDLLKQHKIRPIFLKGTAHIIEGLYLDIAERMVGDIDLIVPKNQVEKVATILINEGYKPMSPFVEGEQRYSKHYSRLIHPKAIGAVEIHWALTLQSHKTSLNYQTISKEKRFVNSVYVPSYSHQAIHNMLNTQINDKGFLYGKISPRQLYDGFLLLFKPHVLEDYQQYKYDFYRKTVYFKLVKKVFNIKNLKLDTPLFLRILMLRYDLKINYPKINYFINYIIFLMWRLIEYPKRIIQLFYRKDVRVNVIRNLRTPTWYRQHLRSYKNLGF